MSKFALLSTFLVFVSFLLNANAAPLLARQNLSGPMTVMTVTNSMTAAGPLVQTCIITLTPITDGNGQPAVEEVKQCTVTVDTANNSGNNGGNNSGSSDTTTSTDSSTSTDSTSSSSTDSASSTSTDSVTATTTDTTTTDSSATTSTDSSSASSTSGGLSDNGFSTLPAISAEATGSTTSASDSAATSSVSATDSSSATDSAASSTATDSGSAASGSTDTASSSSSASDAADNGTTPTAAAASEPSQSDSESFAVPGKSISVLPIGLGVFAGISVIALIVVGLVTYERTKYRKAFRQRKLAEQGSGMGYGGMAERT